MKYNIGMVFKTNCGIDCEIIGFPSDKKQYATVKWQDSYGFIGDYPLGIYRHSSGNFVAQVKNRAGVTRYLGIKNSPDEAHKLWQIAKSEIIIQTVERYKDEQAFDMRVADSLICKAEELKFNAENGVETKSFYH